MTRLLIPVALLAVLGACDTLETNPCQRYADFLCDCYGTDSPECRDGRILAQNPTADVQDSCEIDLADAQRDTSECLPADTGDTGDTGMTWEDTGW